MITARPLAAMFVLVAAGAPAQGDAAVPEDFVATFVLLGKPAGVTQNELSLELALHYRLRTEGQAAREQLINSRLVKIEATTAGVEPSAQEIEATWQVLEQSMRQAGQSLEAVLHARNRSREDYADEIALSISHRRLTMRALGLGSINEVTGAMQQLWLKDARKRHAVVTDPDQLPAGAIAKVDDGTIGLIALGDLLGRTRTLGEREKFVRQIAARHILEAKAAAAKIELSEADIDAEVEKRRQLAESDPRFKGVPFEELLKAQGHSLGSLKASKTFHANIILRRLVDRDHPPDALQKQLDQDRELLVAQHGPRRRIGIVLLRAMEVPNDLIPRTFDEALEDMQKLAEGIAKGAVFDKVARLNSEDAATQVEGGDAGWHHRADEDLPPEVLEAAFAMPLNGVSAPVRGEAGYFLVKVLAAEPTPDDAEICRRMRSKIIDETTASLLEEAQVKMRR